MSKDNLISLPSTETQDGFRDALSELIRRGARQLIAEAVEALRPKGSHQRTSAT